MGKLKPPNEVFAETLTALASRIVKHYPPELDKEPPVPVLFPSMERTRSETESLRAMWQRTVLPGQPLNLVKVSTLLAACEAESKRAPSSEERKRTAGKIKLELEQIKRCASVHGLGDVSSNTIEEIVSASMFNIPFCKALGDLPYLGIYDEVRDAAKSSALWKTANAHSLQKVMSDMKTTTETLYFCLESLSLAENKEFSRYIEFADEVKARRSEFVAEQNLTPAEMKAKAARAEATSGPSPDLPLPDAMSSNLYKETDAMFQVLSVIRTTLAAFTGKQSQLGLVRQGNFADELAKAENKAIEDEKTTFQALVVEMQEHVNAVVETTAVARDIETTKFVITGLASASRFLAKTQTEWVPGLKSQLELHTKAMNDRLVERADTHMRRGALQPSAVFSHWAAALEAFLFRVRVDHVMQAYNHFLASGNDAKAKARPDLTRLQLYNKAAEFKSAMIREYQVRFQKAARVHQKPDVALVGAYDALLSWMTLLSTGIATRATVQEAALRGLVLSARRFVEEKGQIDTADAKKIVSQYGSYAVAVFNTRSAPGSKFSRFVDARVFPPLFQRVVGKGSPTELAVRYAKVETQNEVLFAASDICAWLPIVAASLSFVSQP